MKRFLILNQEKKVKSKKTIILSQFLVVKGRKFYAYNYAKIFHSFAFTKFGCTTILCIKLLKIHKRKNDEALFAP